MVTGCCGTTDSNYPGKVPPFLPERVHIGLGPVGLLGLVAQKTRELAGNIGYAVKITGHHPFSTAKIADALEVSLDYLVGATSFVVKDKKMLHRLELLEKIDENDRETILKVVDNYLTTAQLQTTTKKLKQKA